MIPYNARSTRNPSTQKGWISDKDMSDILQTPMVGTILAFAVFTLCFTPGIPSIVGFMIYGVM